METAGPSASILLHLHAFGTQDPTLKGGGRERRWGGVPAGGQEVLPGQLEGRQAGCEEEEEGVCAESQEGGGM